jgi:hypothetical protein
MDEITITSAKYAPNITRDSNDTSTIEAVIGGITYAVPLDPANRHYAEIMRQVDAGELTIADAD